jgi:hypothetical protein
MIKAKVRRSPIPASLRVTYLIVELTRDDDLSELFLRLFFPYEDGDTCILEDFAHSRAILRLARSALTGQQKFLLQTTPAIVGYTHTNRAGLTRRWTRCQERGWNGK